MRTRAEIEAEIDRIQTMRYNFERDYRWRTNNLYFVKGLEWVLENSELGENYDK